MSQKSQKGIGLVEVLVITGILLIIGAIVTPGLIEGRYSDFFKESFGIEIRNNQLNDEKRYILQPLITKRLRELESNLQTAQKEKADLLTMPETITSEEAMQRINKFNEIETKITSAYDAFNAAKKSAEYFGFKT
ncbi:MAG: hypothetical protein HYT65_03825 [Candidatus Yanofskybacteria bacterium]|nr:hypothetical protein [Candidatus Yanofskybacteria bacterium]